MNSAQRELQRGTEVLQSSGIEGAARDARLLLAHAYGIAADRLTLHLPDLADDAADARFEALVAARAVRKPISHLLGRREFWGRWFKVTPDVLDPRPETECLIAAALEEPFNRILDLGTGSGCILVTLLAERPGARGVGTDVAEKAVLVAGDNAVAHGVADRIILPLSEWWDDVGGKYDLIVSNPPYIALREMAGLQPEVRDHEPRVALTDEGTGLSAYREIAAGLVDHLTPGGRVLFEIGASQARDVSEILAQAGLAEIEIRQDFDGRDRVILARKPQDSVA